MDETLLTPEEVAAALKVKPSTIKQWLRLGKLKGVRLAGKTWRVRKQDVEAFIASGQTDAPEEE